MALPISASFLSDNASALFNSGFDEETCCLDSMCAISLKNLNPHLHVHAPSICRYPYAQQRELRLYLVQPKNKSHTARSAAETAAPTSPALAFHVPSAMLGIASPLGRSLYRISLRLSLQAVARFLLHPGRGTVFDTAALVYER